MCKNETEHCSLRNQKDEINEMFHDIEAEAKKLINAESATLFMIKKEDQEVWTRTRDLEDKVVFALHDKDIIFRVLSEKEAIIENR